MLQEAQFATQQHHHILIHLGSTLCYTCIRSVAVPNCTSLCKEEVYRSIGSVKQIKRDRMKKKKKGYAEISEFFLWLCFLPKTHPLAECSIVPCCICLPRGSQQLCCHRNPLLLTSPSSCSETPLRTEVISWTQKLSSWKLHTFPVWQFSM